MPSWAIGITTAPRNPSFLEHTIKSLELAGWKHSEMYVFAEPFSATPKHFTGWWFQNPTLHGAWRNWREGLSDLIEKNPWANYFAMVQDDIHIRPGLRDHLERTCQTLNPMTVLSPYLSKKDKRMLNNQQGWVRCTTGWHFCGACFMVMNNCMAQTMNKDLPLTVPENKHIDAYVAKYLADCNYDLYVHNPSLIQHLADAHSTLGYSANPFARTAADFTEEPLNE